MILQLNIVSTADPLIFSDIQHYSGTILVLAYLCLFLVKNSGKIVAEYYQQGNIQCHRVIFQF
jgi:hypothetical protein